MNIFKYSCLLVSLCIFFCQGYAQDVKVPLEPMVGPESFHLIMPKETAENIEDFKGIDTSRYKLWQLYAQTFSYEQGAYEIGGMAFLKRIYPDADPRFIYMGKIKKNKIASFVGLDHKGVFHATIDANNNGDFGDDRWYSFEADTSIDEFDRTGKDVTCSFSYYDSKKIRDTALKMHLSFTIFHPGTVMESDYNQDGRLKGKFQLLLMRLSYKTGVTSYKGQKYQFFVTDKYYNLYPFAKEYTLRVKGLPRTAIDKDYTYYSSSQVLIRLNNSLFRMPKLLSDTLTLTYVGEAENGDASIGKAMPPGVATDLLTGKKYKLGDKTEKYMVIDFWASWCGPCIKALPALKTLKSKYESKNVQVLSLAVDDVGNKEKLLKIIAEFGLDWPQLYMDAKKEGKAFLKASYTQAFPTTLLIDPEGVVIYRGTSEKAIKEVDEQLTGILKL